MGKRQLARVLRSPRRTGTRIAGLQAKFAHGTHRLPKNTCIASSLHVSWSTGFRAVANGCPLVPVQSGPIVSNTVFARAIRDTARPIDPSGDDRLRWGAQRLRSPILADGLRSDNGAFDAASR